MQIKPIRAMRAFDGLRLIILAVQLGLDVYR